MEKNVFGEPIKVCCSSPMTGYFRDGLCRTISQDTGTHTVCAVISQAHDSLRSRTNCLYDVVSRTNRRTVEMQIQKRLLFN